MIDRLTANQREALVRALDDLPAKSGERVPYGWNPNVGYAVPRVLNGEVIDVKLVIDGVALWNCAILTPIGYALAKEIRDGQKAA